MKESWKFRRNEDNIYYNISSQLYYDSFRHSYVPTLTILVDVPDFSALHLHICWKKDQETQYLEWQSSTSVFLIS